jgi:hypothetical protein
MHNPYRIDKSRELWILTRIQLRLCARSAARVLDVTKYAIVRRLRREL